MHTGGKPYQSFSVQDWTGSTSLVLYKTAYVVCCLLFVFMHRYLLCKYKEPEAVILHVDSKSANLGPRLIFVSKFYLLHTLFELRLLSKFQNYSPRNTWVIKENVWTKWGERTIALYKTAYVVCSLFSVLVNYARLSSPKPNKARQCRFAHQPRINFSRTWANFYFEICRKSLHFSPKCVHWFWTIIREIKLRSTLHPLHGL